MKSIANESTVILTAPTAEKKTLLNDTARIQMNMISIISITSSAENDVTSSPTMTSSSGSVLDDNTT